MYGGISLKGRYHDINQDCYVCSPYRDGYVLVVSDGMGSKRLSQYGSKAICESVYEIINKKTLDPEMMSFKNILLQCHEEWLKRLKDYDISQCYATMLVVVVTHKKVFAGRLGDGFIGIYTNNGIKCLFDSKEDYFTNETDCLTEFFDKDKLEVYECEYEEFFGAVACTDGIEIGTMQESELMSFTKEFVEEYRRLDISSIKDDISNWLSDWSGNDDKSIAFILGGKTDGKASIY